MPDAPNISDDPGQPGPDATVADALVLTLTRGMSLAEWARLGLIDREWGLYQKLAPHYRAIVVLSYGDEAAERAIAAEMIPRPIVIAPADAPETPARVRAALADASCAVVKTNQMEGVGPAIRVTRQLRADGLCVGLVGRGGYLRSRFAADQFGPASRQAADAAAEEHGLCAAADVIVGTTPEMAHALAWRYGVQFERTRVIPNFVLVDPAAASACDRDPVVLYAGQLVARKRVHMLIQAMARLSPDNRKATLSIVGEGPEEGSLKGLASDLGVRAAFEKRVGHAELLRRMSRASIYAQASSLEGHPKTVIEAMASGAAVVVTDAPGMGDVLTHGVTGLRVDSQPGAIADAVDLLLTDQAWREQLGNAAAHVAQERYGLGTILPRELEAHRAAIASAGRFVRPDVGVRWDASLPDAGAEAGAAWERSLAAFARRLGPGQGEAVLGQIERAAAGLRAKASRERRATG